MAKNKIKIKFVWVVRTVSIRRPDGCRLNRLSAASSAAVRTVLCYESGSSDRPQVVRTIVRTVAIQNGSSAAASVEVRTVHATVHSVAIVRSIVRNVVRTVQCHYSLSGDRPHHVRSRVRTDHLHYRPDGSI